MVQYKLLDRKTDENSFFLNQNGTKDESRKIDFTNGYGIINPFFIIDKVTGARIQKRYIAGCPIYDPLEQEKQKYVFNMQSGMVEFNKGADIVLAEDLGKVLIDWLDIHPWNTGSPYHDPERHPAVFYKFDPKAKQKEEIANVDEQDEALDILRALRKNPERMRAVALVFDETAGMQDDDEIYIGLRNLANDKPKIFKDSIANKENEFLSDVLKATKYNIIGKDAKGYFYEDDKTGIFETTTKDGKAASKELVTFLMSKPGDVHYRQILIKTQQKEIEMSSPKT